MKYFYNFTIAQVGKQTLLAINVLVFCLLFLSIGTIKAQLYQHDFGTTTISAHPYNVAPGVINANLNSSSWANSTSAWTSFGGSTGQALSLNNSSGTPTITLSLNVAAGFQANITSFSFWRQRSTTGAQNWTMTINGIAVGAGTVPTTGASTGTIAVGAAVNNQTGTLDVVLTLSAATGTGTFRLDDFTLNGTVIPAPTLSIPASGGGSLTSFGNVCIGTVAGANTFTITGTALTAANVTVGALAGFTYSVDNLTFTNSLSIVQPGGAFSRQIYVRFSPVLVQSYSGNIPIGGGGAPTKNVAAIGIGVNTMPTITNGTVSAITTTAANVNATISTTGCTAISAYGVEYSTVPGFANGTGTAVAGGALAAGNYTSNLVGLAPPGQIFYFHTYATNAGGTVYGIEGSFTLLNTVPSLTVPASGGGSLAPFGNVCVNTSLTNSFNLSGSVLNGSNITIAALANYSYSVFAGGPFTNTLVLVNGGSGYSYTGTTLTATIYVRFVPTAVATYNGNIGISGGGAAAINVAATGAGINTPPTVISNAAIYVTTTSATMPGNISVPGCGVILSYGFEYSTAPFAPGTGTVLPSSNLAAGNFSAGLSGLTPNTTYYYYAYAVNAGGTSYGAQNSFTTFSIPVKLVIITITPTSPIALTPFSVTIQAQDAAGNPVDVTADTELQLSQIGGTGTITFPNSNAPAGILYEGANTITIPGFLYDVIETVGLTATASLGMVSLGTSVTNNFNVIAYTGSTNFIWNNSAGSAWLTGTNWTTNPTPPGIGGIVNTNIATFSSNASVTSGGIGINMSSVSGDYNLGTIYFNQNYTTPGVAGFGNSSGLISGTLTLHGAALNTVGGISGNNFAKLLIANYANNGTGVVEIKNSVGGGQPMTLALENAGSMAAGLNDTININVLLTGTNSLTFTGGGALSLLPSGAATTNTFSGPIIVAKGSLLAGSSGAFSAVAPNAITLGSNTANAGRLRLMGNSVTIGGLSSAGTAGNGNIVDNNDVTPATLTVINSAANTFSGSLQNGGTGALSLVKNGTGNLTFNGLSSFTGTTVINNGSVILSRTGGGTFPSTSVITVNGTGILRISSDQVIKDINLATGGTLRVDAGITLTITGNYNAASCNILNFGTIRMQGTAPQTFPGTAAVVSSMNNLTINNVFGVNLNNSLNIGGTLNLNSGTFTVGAYTLTLNNPITGTLPNFSANNTSSIIIAGTAAGVNIPASVTQLNNLTVSNTVGSMLQGNLNVATNLVISAGTLWDNQFILNGTANVTMTGGTLNLEQNTAVLPGLTGVYVLTAGTVVFNGVGTGSDAQTVRPINYFNLTSTSTGDRILSPTGIIGVANVFTPNLPANAYTVINSTVDYNKLSAQSIAGFKYYHMTLSGAGGIIKTLSGDIDIQGTLTLVTNTKFALGNFNTTLKSNATNTASVAIINTTNSITYGTGQFIVERYIPTGVAHGKSWQLLAVPVSGSQSVKAAWQEGNAPIVIGTPGFGTTISSERAGAVGRGYDFYTAIAPSIKTYAAATGLWVGTDDGVTNTSSLPIANKKGYMIFIRGDRSVQSSATAANVTTLRTAGKIFSPGTDAPPSTTVAAGKFETAGNPYASAIDFTNVLGISSGIDARYYVWDPLLPGTNGLGYGGYQLISSANLWKPVPGSINYPAAVPYNKIQSGQAFFVYSTGGGTMNFNENNKLSGSNMVFRGTSVQSNRQFLRAYLKGASNGIMADGNVVAFDEVFSNNFDADDAIKIDNGTESFGITSHRKTMALEARSPVLITDTIFYKLANLSVKEYQLQFEPENMEASGLTAYLVDRFLNTTSIIDLSGNTSVNFNITNDQASKQSDRFYLVFRQARPVPVTFVDVSATRSSNSAIDVRWNVENEINIDNYLVERSSDGRNFGTVGSALPVSNNGNRAGYNFKDENTLKTDNYYRISAVSISGQIQYSRIVKVGSQKQPAQISVYPNPVVDRKMTVYFEDQPDGLYTISIINSLGQVVYNNAVTVNGQTFTKTFQLGNELNAGIYQVSIKAGEKHIVQQVLIK